MKEITKEITRVEKHTIYQAVDGTGFSNKEECEKYENSARGVLRGRFMQLAACTPLNAWELMGGYDDHEIIAVRISTEADKDVVKQTYYLDNSYLLENQYKDRRQTFEAKVEQAFCNNDLLLFGLNCDEALYVIDTRLNIVNRLNNLAPLEESYE